MKNKYIILLFSLVFLIACNDEHISIPDGDGDGTPPLNQAPTAVISASSTNALVSTPVYFLSSSSSDPEGDVLTYYWSIDTKPSNSNPSITDQGDDIKVIFDQPGDYIIQLRVSDGELESVANQAINVISNTPPSSGNEQVVAIVGGNQKSIVGNTVILDGHSSYDTLNNSLTFAWTLTKPSGSNATLSSASDVFPTFIPDVDGTYQAQLVVKANGINSQAVTSIIAVGNVNTPPMANAGHDISTSAFVNNSNTVTLDGSLSHDLDGDVLSYFWEIHDKPSGSSASLTDDHTPHPTLTTDMTGDYELTLVVSDGQSYSQVDSVIVEQLIASGSVNHKPVANAGIDQKVPANNVLITLDGTASSDVDGDSLTYQWRVSSEPAGSSVSLTNSTGLMPTFTPSHDGSYVVSLTVNDGLIDSLPDNVAVVVASTTNTNHTPQVALTNNASATPAVNTAILFTASVTDLDANDTHTYQWNIISQPNGSSAPLNESLNTSTLTPDVLGIYIVQVIATDSAGASSVAVTNSITVSGVTPPNQAPTAVISASSTNALVSTPVYFLSSSSSDPEGDVLTYYWSIDTKPSNSNPSITDQGDDIKVIFDQPGDYIIQLRVSDGELESVANQAINVISNTPPSSGNEQVVAIVGGNQKSIVGNTVILDGHSSYDTLNNSLTFAWTLTKPSGSNATLSSASDVFPTFIPDVDGTYQAQLVVKANGINSQAVTSIIAVGNVNTPPMANAGHDISTSAFVNNSNTVTLDGSLSHDLDGDVLSYFWEIHDKPSGSSASLTDDHTPHPTLTTDMTGDYELTLVVSDGQSYSQVDSVIVEQLIASGSVNHKPVANAGIDQKVPANNVLITLDGTASSDVDGDSLTYQWRVSSEPAGSSVSLTNSTGLMPTFTPSHDGSYVVSLTVNDGLIDSLPDNVAVVVASTTNTNHAPQVALTNNASANPAVNTAILFTASVTDLDANDTHTYQWNIVSQPNGSSAPLTDSSNSATLTPDTSGTYTVQVVVTDNAGASSTAVTNSIVVTVVSLPANQPPNHTVSLNSSLGGQDGAGALYVFDKDDLAAGLDITASNRTTMYQFTGFSPLVSPSKYQKFTYNQHDQKFYAQIDSTGIFAGGTILSYDPTTNKIEIVSHIFGGTIDGYRVYSFVPRVTIHPNGKYLIGNTRFGGKYNGGRFYLVNIDKTDARYGEVSWIYDLGCGDDATGAISVSGANCSPTKLFGGEANSYALWDDAGTADTSDDQIETYAHYSYQPISGNPAIPIDGLNSSSGLLRLKPSDTSDLTKRWEYVAPGVNFNMQTPIISFSKNNQYYLSLQKLGSNGGTLFSENGGGGVVQFGCENALGIIYDQMTSTRQSYAFCSGNSKEAPTFYAGTSSSSVSAIRTYIKNPTFSATGFDLGSTGFGGLVTYNGAGAETVILAERQGISYPLPYDVAQVKSLNITSGAESSIITGSLATGSDLGSYFLGSATSDNSGKYVVTLSLDGGKKEKGAILKYDRDTGAVEATSLGFDTIGYSYGKPFNSFNGALYTSGLYSSELHQNKGTHNKYDATQGLIEIKGNGALQPGIAFVEAGSSNNIYSIGVDVSQSNHPYALYEIDSSTDKIKKLFTSFSSAHTIADKVVSVATNNPNELLFSYGDETINNIYCYDLAHSNAGYSPDYVTLEKGINHGFKHGSMTANLPHDLYMGLTYFPADSAWYFVANKNAGNASPSIQKFSNCVTPTSPVTHITDISNPATTMPLAVGSNLYIGSVDELLSFDGSVVTAHSLQPSLTGYTNISIEGYLSELSSGLIAGVLIADNTANEEEHFIFTFNPTGSVFTVSKLAKDMPLDTYYPGVVEIQ
ncbi:MAG: PKD domain-containing protein [Colwellia sp.]